MSFSCRFCSIGWVSDRGRRGGVQSTLGANRIPPFRFRLFHACDFYIYCTCVPCRILRADSPWIEVPKVVLRARYRIAGRAVQTSRMSESLAEEQGSLRPRPQLRPELLDTILRNVRYCGPRTTWYHICECAANGSKSKQSCMRKRTRAGSCRLFLLVPLFVLPILALLRAVLHTSEALERRAAANAGQIRH